MFRKVNSIVLIKYEYTYHLKIPSSVWNTVSAYLDKLVSFALLGTWTI